MTEPDAVARAIRGLTYAVWSLCVLILAMLSMPLWSSWLFQAPRDDVVPVESSSFESLPGEVGNDFDNDFSARPLKEKVERASMIMLVKRELEDEKHRAIIAEIIKQKPGVRFFYKIGDEYEHLSHSPRDNCMGCEGEGNLVFLTGNPAQMREAFSISNDRVGGLGDITLDELRRLVHAEPGEP
ncbi:MAG: hypothetical protein F9K18_05520 [Thermoanaerobaculia bacterium]|nr:MAG: hypothetical protein F9K18_05520 [Thermoanaerobaculia bacterium]